MKSNCKPLRKSPPHPTHRTWAYSWAIVLSRTFRARAIASQKTIWVPSLPIAPPWTSAFGASDSDEADDTKESKSDGAYDEFAASSLRLWKGDDADLGGGDCQSELTGDNDKSKKGGEKKRRNGNKKKGKSTKNALESRSLQYCRRGRKLGEIPGLYRILFDDGDFEDEEPNDVYEGALKYHKMVREDHAYIVKYVQRSPIYLT